MPLSPVCPHDLQRNAPKFTHTSTLGDPAGCPCVLPRSGQYCIYQRHIYCGLLIATIIITIVLNENHALWLASVAAAMPLYSGVAAVHQILIFDSAQNTEVLSTCAVFPLLGTNYTLPIFTVSTIKTVIPLVGLLEPHCWPSSTWLCGQWCSKRRRRGLSSCYGCP